MLTIKRPIILVIDDNPRNAAVIEGYLKPHYDVLKAFSGEDCLDLIKKETVDLVILDVALPGINGYEVCRRIKSNVATKNIPVILIPALPTGQEKIRSLQSGAEDFMDRPFGMNEVVARVKSLLKIKNLYNDLERANENLVSIVSYTANILKEFNPLTFSDREFYKSLLNMILRQKPYEREKPTHVFLGKKDGGDIKGKIFSYGSEPVECSIPENSHYGKENVINHNGLGLTYSNHTEETSILKYQERFRDEIKKVTGTIINFVSCTSKQKVITAFNYGRPVSLSDAHIIKGLTIHIPFFKSLSRHIKDSGEAFIHTVGALSKAAEANEDGTGRHILRLGRYSALLAERLGLPERFIHDIGTAAQMHDVGKIHVHPDILKKPGDLSTEEFETVKQHPLYGASIIGEHPKLRMARAIALTHHERWDGSGYPYGLKGDVIPVEGRIINISDQYDALRSARPHKPVYSHEKTCRIITEGDGRTMPEHFDPEVLKAFKEIAGSMGKIYSELQ